MPWWGWAIIALIVIVILAKLGVLGEALEGVADALTDIDFDDD